MPRTLFTSLPLWLLFFLTLSVNSVLADEILSQANYRGEYGLLTITAERKLIDHGNNRYTYMQETDNPLGSIIEKSEFELSKDNLLIPQYYLYEQNVLGNAKRQEIQFDWQQMNATYTSKKGKINIPLTKGILDPLLYQLQLQKDLLTDQESLSYQFLKRNRIRTYSFRRTGTENITYLNQQHPALKIEKMASDNKRDTEIWFSPDNLFHMTKLTHREKDESYTLALTSLRSSTRLASWLRNSNSN